MATRDASDSGNPRSTKAPYGYMWNDRVLVVNPDEAPVRKLIYEWFARLRRKKAVARALNDAGYRTRAGARWSDTTIDRLIRDTTAKGRHQSAKDQGMARGRQGPNKAMEIDPIVSDELWDQCNALLNGGGAGKRRGRRPLHLFAGLAVCQCGRRMYVRPNSTNYRCSACGNRIPADDLEAIFVQQVKTNIPSPEMPENGWQELWMRWGVLGRDEKRAIVEGVTERIVVGHEEIDVLLCRPSSLPAVGRSAETSEQPVGINNAVNYLRDKVDPVALAIAMMKDHPEWSARRLAQSAGCSHTTLTRSPLYRTAKAIATSKGKVSSGWKAKDGGIEAIADEDE